MLLFKHCQEYTRQEDNFQGCRLITGFDKWVVFSLPIWVGCASVKFSPGHHERTISPSKSQKSNLKPEEDTRN